MHDKNKCHILRRGQILNPSNTKVFNMPQKVHKLFPSITIILLVSNTDRDSDYI